MEEMTQADIQHKIKLLEQGLITRRNELKKFNHLAYVYAKQVKSYEKEIAELTALLEG